MPWDDFGHLLAEKLRLPNGTGTYAATVLIKVDWCDAIGQNAFI